MCCIQYVPASTVHVTSKSSSTLIQKGACFAATPVSITPLSTKTFKLWDLPHKVLHQRNTLQHRSWLILITISRQIAQVSKFVKRCLRHILDTVSNADGILEPYGTPILGVHVATYYKVLDQSDRSASNTQQHNFLCAGCNVLPLESSGFMTSNLCTFHHFFFSQNL